MSSEKITIPESLFNITKPSNSKWKRLSVSASNPKVTTDGIDAENNKDQNTEIEPKQDIDINLLSDFDKRFEINEQYRASVENQISPVEQKDIVEPDIVETDLNEEIKDKYELARPASPPIVTITPGITFSDSKFSHPQTIYEDKDLQDTDQINYSSNKNFSASYTQIGTAPPLHRQASRASTTHISYRRQQSTPYLFGQSDSICSRSRLSVVQQKELAGYENFRKSIEHQAASTQNNCSGTGPIHSRTYLALRRTSEFIRSPFTPQYVKRTDFCNEEAYHRGCTLDTSIANSILKTPGADIVLFFGYQGPQYTDEELLSNLGSTSHANIGGVCTASKGATRSNSCTGLKCSNTKATLDSENKENVHGHTNCHAHGLSAVVNDHKVSRTHAKVLSRVQTQTNLHLPLTAPVDLAEVIPGLKNASENANKPSIYDVIQDFKKYKKERKDEKNKVIKDGGFSRRYSVFTRSRANSVVTGIKRLSVKIGSTLGSEVDPDGTKGTLTEDQEGEYGEANSSGSKGKRTNSAKQSEINHLENLKLCKTILHDNDLFSLYDSEEDQENNKLKVPDPNRPSSRHTIPSLLFEGAEKNRLPDSEGISIATKDPISDFDSKSDATNYTAGKPINSRTFGNFLAPISPALKTYSKSSDFISEQAKLNKSGKAGSKRKKRKRKRNKIGTRVSNRDEYVLTLENKTSTSTSDNPPRKIGTEVLPESQRGTGYINFEQSPEARRRFGLNSQTSGPQDKHSNQEKTDSFSESDSTETTSTMDTNFTDINAQHQTLSHKNYKNMKMKQEENQKNDGQEFFDSCTANVNFSKFNNKKSTKSTNGNGAYINNNAAFSNNKTINNVSNANNKTTIQVQSLKGNLGRNDFRRNSRTSAKDNNNLNLLIDNKQGHLKKSNSSVSFADQVVEIGAVTGQRSIFGGAKHFLSASKIFLARIAI